jgi:hypothetical protein
MRSFKADKKIITFPLNGVEYFVFIDISAYRLQNFFLEKSTPHFSINLRNFAIFFNSWKGRAVGFDPTLGFLLLSMTSRV